jgi:hypothetical protein
VIEISGFAVDSLATIFRYRFARVKTNRRAQRRDPVAGADSSEQGAGSNNNPTAFC